MITVFQVSGPDLQPTRLHLACTAWGEQVRSALVYMGFTVQPTDEQAWPDHRDAAELARRDALLDLTGI
jgi:hypothetical protein